MHANDSILPSPSSGPISWAPTGRFLLVRPIGMLMAGRPILLNRTVFLSKAYRVHKTLPFTLIFTSSEINGAVTIVVGTMIILKHPEDSLRENSALISPIIFLEFR